MKPLIVLLSVVAIAFAGFLILRRPSSDLPSGHDRAPDGVYFLRAAQTITSAGQMVRWTAGKQLFADRVTKTSAPEGTILVSDGTTSAVIPANMLSYDVQEGQALHKATVDADRDKRQEQSEEQRRMLEAMRPTPTPRLGKTALDKPAHRTHSHAGGETVYY